MSELRFRISGASDDGVRWRRRRPSPGRPLLAVAVVAVLGTLALESDPLDRGRRRVAVVADTEVRANRVIVLVDNSDSTRGTETAVQAQLDRLFAAGIVIDHRETIPGFWVARSPDTLFDRYVRAAAANPTADAVYIVSDFTGRDAELNETAAWDELVAAARGRGQRLYWATVRDDPLPVYYEVARALRGAVIPLE